MKSAVFNSFVSCCLFLVAIPISAASPSVYFRGPEVPLAVGSEFTVKLLVDSAGSLNAYAVELSYPAQNLTVLSFDESRSIIGFWQSQPTISEDGLIKFSGGSFAPWKGTAGELLTVRFGVSGSGNAELSFKNIALYAADGKGTKISPTTGKLGLTLAPQGSLPVTIEPTAKDTTPPEIDSLEIVPDPFNGEQKILSFAVSDSGSGVKEILGRSVKWFSWSDWQTLGNSVAIDKAVWAVDFKATDNAGNTTEKIIYDWPAFWRLIVGIFSTLFVIILIVLLVGWGIKKRRRSAKALP